MSRLCERQGGRDRMSAYLCMLCEVKRGTE